MANTLIKEASIVNEGKEVIADVLIKDRRIEQIDVAISPKSNFKEINAAGKWLFPGCIDDQVHFRQPGLTHKADIYTESRAAVAGGITSFMEMPNTNPPAVTQALLEEKYQIASKNALANYSFFMGTTNDNAEEVLKTDPETICGIKIFMGSSTGNMLVDNDSTLRKIFCNTPLLIATHCEDEATIKASVAALKAEYGEGLNAAMHPLARNVDACYNSSSKAIEIAKSCGTRLHVLHISTEKELSLFSNAKLTSDKKITAEACVHHLWFDAEDYDRLGNLIKCNPAIKDRTDRDAIRKALVDGCIDVVATDHAPHTWEEKQQTYSQAPSGLPLVQHSLLMMLQIAEAEGWSKAFVAEKMAHNPAILFSIVNRGYIREGYWADLVLVDKKPLMVKKSDLLFKCGWSPLENTTFDYTIDKTWVSGNLAYENGKIINDLPGHRLSFSRK